MAELGDRLSGLSPEKRALLEQQLLKRRAAAGSAASARLKRRLPGDPTPLSFAQQQLWFLDQWEPGSAAYNASLSMRLEGELDVDCLRRAFDTIVARHECLRSVVHVADGVPEAKVLTDVGATVRLLDLTGRAGIGGDELADVVREEVDRPFDLENDLPLRVAVVKLGGSSHVLSIIMHHIACDGLSRGVLFTELTALYNAYLEGKESPLPELSVQYGDYAAWQQEWLQGDVLRAEVDFWREELAGTDLILNLPTDHPRPEVLGFHGERVRFVVPAASADRIRSAARQERATMFMAVHAVSGVFLHGLTGQLDFLVGSPVANRRWPETEPLVGFFVNTILFRLRLQGDPTFRELLRRSRETAVRCYAHQELPFERLVQALRPKRRPDRNPLFQVNLRMQGESPAPPELTGLVASRLNVGLGSSRFDLALGFVESTGDLAGYIEYNTALFARETIVAWQGLLNDMITRAGDDPDQPLSTLVSALTAVRMSRGG